MQVEDRPDGDRDEDESMGLVNKIFKKKPESMPEPEAPAKHFGTGFRLGASLDGPVHAVRDAPVVESNEPIVITFWRQGFTVDEAPLRKYEEPSNAQFLRDIEKG